MSPERTCRQRDSMWAVRVAIVLVFLVPAVIAWALTAYHLTRGMAPYWRWRHRLSEQRVAPFGLTAFWGGQSSFNLELRLVPRLLGSSTEPDAATERERVAARTRFLAAGRFGLIFVALCVAAFVVAGTYEWIT